MNINTRVKHHALVKRFNKGTGVVVEITPTGRVIVAWDAGYPDSVFTMESARKFLTVIDANTANAGTPVHY